MENPEQQPGQVVGPASPAPQQVEPRPNAAPEPERPPEQAAPVVQTQPELSQAPVAPTPEPAGQWGFRSEEEGTAPATLPSEEISWTALEFIPHEKSFAWYAALTGIGLAGAALMYLISRDILSTSVVVVAALMMGIFAARKPREQVYELDIQGLHVGPRSYSLQHFKSFSVTNEGELGSIIFMPLRRFMPPLTIYVDPAQEDNVVDFLAARLPLEQHRQDMVDALLRRIHF